VTRRLALLLVLLVPAACRAPEPARPPAKAAVKPAAKPATATADDDTVSIAAPIADIDGDNLLNLAYGASVVSRTGELNLVNSAVHAIDGMSTTLWTSSPGAPEQTLVFGLGGPSRIERLGVTAATKDRVPAKVRFDASADGSSWREIATLAPANRGTSMIDVTPFEARYLRVTTIDPAKYYSGLTSIHALGREVRPVERLSFEGCWTINTRPARLVQRGARITGTIGGGRPTFVDGGIEGRVAKLMWMRGPMWGYATATVTPDGKGISAITFHEEPLNNRAGEAWMGNRCDAPAAATPVPPPIDYLRRIGHWTMSGIVFDAAEHLIAEPSAVALDDAAAVIRAMPSQRFRIVAYEFRHTDPRENRRRTDARIDAVRAALRARGVDVSRIEFIAGGSERTDVDLPSALQRMLFSRVDLILSGR
jgi:outer membrane protein OmpA-like peptidoglycan-associated protein